MRAHTKYLSYVVRHKWFVFLAGLKVGAPLWRLVIHDWSKFLPSEWFPYVAHFYGSPPHLNPAYFGPQLREKEAAAWKARAEADFDRAWNFHQKRQPHHWQFWLLMQDQPPRYPQYHITSADGGMIHHGLTEYNAPLPDQQAITAAFTDEALRDVGGDSETQKRYEMVSRCCRAANARRPVALPMPEGFIREMVADWMGAGRAITGRWEALEWYRKNRENMVLHPATRERVEAILAEAPR